MRLSFWTLGLKDWSLGDVLDKARLYGYAGVDLSLRREPAGVAVGPLDLSTNSSDAELAQIHSSFQEAEIAIPSVMCEPGPDMQLGWDPSDVAVAARICEYLGVPQFRTWIGNPPPGRSWHDHLATSWDALSTALDGTQGVAAMVENHAGSAGAGDLLEAAERFSDARIGVELSPDHTLTMQEDALSLIDRHGRHVRQVCFADRKLVREDLASFDGRYYHIRYEAVAPGEGDVPAAEIISRLKSLGYDGYISLKIEKGKMKNGTEMGANLPDAETMLAMFADYVGGLLAKVRER